MSDNIKILHVNSRGIKNKLYDLIDLINNTKPDIISLQETWLQENDNTNYDIQNYKKIEKRRKNSKKGGGQTLYYNQNYILINAHEKDTINDNELLQITLQLENNKKLL